MDERTRRMGEVIGNLLAKGPAYERAVVEELRTHRIPMGAYAITCLSADAEALGFEVVRERNVDGTIRRWRYQVKGSV